jgi:hypothetical protein
MTDREFFQGHGTLDQQFGGDTASLMEVVSSARAHGYNPGAHDVYMDNLAQFPGDPDAFVPATGGRGHVQKVCEKRGWSCKGSVNVKSAAPKRDAIKSPKTDLAEDIVQAEVNKRIKRDPANAKRSRAELREEVIGKHALKL